MSVQPGYGRSVKPGYCGEWDKWNGTDGKLVISLEIIVTTLIR